MGNLYASRVTKLLRKVYGRMVFFKSEMAV